EPRTAYPRLLDSPVPWAGRDEDPGDDGVWAVTCFVTRAGFRRRGVSYALARAAVDYARARGARAPARRHADRVLDRRRSEPFAVEPAHFRVRVDFRLRMGKPSMGKPCLTL